MAFDYEPLQSTASNLIANFGQTITFSRIAMTYDGTGAGSSSSSSYSATVALINQAKEEEDGSSITGVIHNAVAYSSTEMLVNDTATINNQNFRILTVTKVQPATTVIFYELQLAS